MDKSEKVIQFPKEKPWVLKKRDYETLMLILRIQDIAEELEKLETDSDPLAPQKVKALGSALEKQVGDFLNIMRGRKTRGKKISPQILASIREQVMELIQEL